MRASVSAEKRELLCRNPDFQPANLAIRNAWFSGGIEWNLGLFGHAFTTCAPLFTAAFTAADGSTGLRLYEFESCTRLFWQLDVTLPPGLPWLVVHVRLLNPGATPAPLYWWTNIAVPERLSVGCATSASGSAATGIAQRPRADTAG